MDKIKTEECIAQEKTKWILAIANQQPGPRMVKPNDGPKKKIRGVVLVDVEETDDDPPGLGKLCLDKTEERVVELMGIAIAKHDAMKSSNGRHRSRSEGSSISASSRDHRSDDSIASSVSAKDGAARRRRGSRDSSRSSKGSRDPSESRSKERARSSGDQNQDCRRTGSRRKSGEFYQSINQLLSEEPQPPPAVRSVTSSVGRVLLRRQDEATEVVPPKSPSPCAFRDIRYPAGQGQVNVRQPPPSPPRGGTGSQSSRANPVHVGPSAGMDVSRTQVGASEVAAITRFFIQYLENGSARGAAGLSTFSFNVRVAVQEYLKKGP